MLCVLIQGDPELVSAIYGRGIAYGKKSLQVSDGCNVMPVFFEIVLYFCIFICSLKFLLYLIQSWVLFQNFKLAICTMLEFIAPQTIWVLAVVVANHISH